MICRSFWIPRGSAGTCWAPAFAGRLMSAAGLANQDAVQVELQGGRTLPAILAVSDGHGSAKCFRSDIGSQLAVKVAAEVLREFAAAISGIPIAQFEENAVQLPGKIVRSARCDWQALAGQSDCRSRVGGDRSRRPNQGPPDAGIGQTIHRVRCDFGERLAGTGLYDLLATGRRRDSVCLARRTRTR